jgi:hypothetical protein
VLALQDEDGRTRVYALPITHSPPEAGEDAIEILAAIKARLKLDGERSWIVVGRRTSLPGLARISAL